MTSHKRSLESQDSFDSSGYTPSFQSSQQSQDASPFESQQEPSYSDRGWRHIFPELIGINIGENEDPAQDEFQEPDETDFLSSADATGAVLETWISEELNNDSIVENGQATRGDVNTKTPEGSDCICYGMIYLAKAKLVGDMPKVLKALQSADVPQTNSGSHFLLDVAVEDGQLFVIITGRVRLAQLNHHLDEALSGFAASSVLELQAIIHKRTLFDDIGSATRAKDAQTTININVYGPDNLSFNIGRHFSENKIWLQKPDWHKTGIAYCNPHVVKIESQFIEDETKVELSEIKESEADSLQKSVHEVYSMLKRDDHLSTSTKEDDRLRTPLLAHQAKALDFLTQRENGPIPDQFRMWETTIKNGETWYQHKVAGIKSRMLPSETGGGILADEMGMGKTFSMLSLIVKSLEAAREWESHPETKLTDGILPTKLLSHATLVVVPSPLLLTTWTDEIDNRLKINLRVHTHHGRDRPIEPEALLNYDVVLTTYHTLNADHKRKYNPVSGIAWYRIILDEAHFVRSPATHLHKRVAELDAKFRWCLTGTPIQNRLDDVGALFSFLKIFPFDRLNLFRRCISVPFKEGGKNKFDAQQDLVKLLDAFCIRRMKALLNMSESNQRICDVQFSIEERKQYNKTKEDMKRAMRNTLSESVSSNRFGMFQAQLQLRLLCNHGTYQRQFHWARARNLLDEHEDAATSFMYNNEGTCSGCHQLIQTFDLAAARKFQDACAHTLCQECRQGTGEQCPLCEVTLYHQKRDKGVTSSRSLQAREAYFQNTGHSSKMQALIREVLNSDLQDKSIIFSHWTTTLDLVGKHLQKADVYFERVDGNDELAHRRRTLDRFRNDEKLRVLIMTTGVGALGLDLIAANQVHLVEPQWNPSIELQAIGRTLRIGQQKTVTVTRYIVKDSVEQYMQHLQQRKLKMAGMTAAANSIPLDKDVKVKSEFQNDFDSIFR